MSKKEKKEIIEIEEFFNLEDLREELEFITSNFNNQTNDYTNWFIN